MDKFSCINVYINTEDSDKQVIIALVLLLGTYLTNYVLFWAPEMLILRPNSAIAPRFKHPRDTRSITAERNEYYGAGTDGEVGQTISDRGT